MKRKKLLTSVLALSIAATTLFATACGGDKSSSSVEDPKLNQAPDYSTYTNQFDFYGYSNPTDGKWKIDGVEYSAGEDFRTVERYAEYKEAGMTIFFPQTTAQIGYYEQKEETWAEVKQYYDMAQEAGLTKAIFNDLQLRHLSTQQYSLVGPNKSLNGKGETYGFKTEAELDAFVAECLSTYIDHPIFYGVYLQDEPTYEKATAYGETYRSIKRVAENVFNREIFVQYNLLPLVTNSEQVNKFYPAVDDYDCTDAACTEQEAIARYTAYMNMFLDSTGADHVCYDHYPLCVDGIRSQYIVGMQIVADICAARDIDFHFVAQTYSQDADGTLTVRVISEEDARWLNNTMLGFGVKNIGYFTYWTKSDNWTKDGEFFHPEGSFMTRYGEKTDVYYIMQKVMAENQKFAPTILNFDYQGSAIYKLLPSYSNSKHIALAYDTYQFKKVSKVETNKEYGLVTELYDEANGNYMYMVQNLVDPLVLGHRVFQTVNVTFTSEYTHVAIYKNGERIATQALVNGVYTAKLAPGEAVFLLPY